MLATVYSRTPFGMEAPEVTIDVHLSAGLPYWSMVGLPEVAVKESRDRVRSAVLNAGFEWPPGRITVNLAPADLPKEGGRFDLPIALALLAADGRLPSVALSGYELYGELALGGALRGVAGLLPAIVRATRERRPVIVPRANAPEARLVAGAQVVAAANLSEVIAHLRGARPLPMLEGERPAVLGGEYPDLADVRGQARACRALEIAAAGGHSALLVGPPGAGKSLPRPGCRPGSGRMPDRVPARTDSNPAAPPKVSGISPERCPSCRRNGVRHPSGIASVMDRCTHASRRQCSAAWPLCSIGIGRPSICSAQRLARSSTAPAEQSKAHTPQSGGQRKQSPISCVMLRARITQSCAIGATGADAVHGTEIQRVDWLRYVPLGSRVPPNRPLRGIKALLDEALASMRRIRIGVRSPASFRNLTEIVSGCN